MPSELICNAFVLMLVLLVRLQKLSLAEVENVGRAMELKLGKLAIKVWTA